MSRISSQKEFLARVEIVRKEAAPKQNLADIELDYSTGTAVS